MRKQDGVGSSSRAAAAFQKLDQLGQPRSFSQRCLLYGRTIRSLRWEQLAYRSVRRLRRSVAALSRGSSPPESSGSDLLGEAVRRWGPEQPDLLLKRAQSALAGRCEHNGVELVFPGAVAWEPSGTTRLWAYEHNYCGAVVDLAWAAELTGEEQYVERMQVLVESWIAGCRRKAALPWDPYPSSMRLSNWVKAISLTCGALDEAFRRRWEESLWEHCAFLNRNLEWDVEANHLLKNLFAIVLGCAYFGHGKASRLLDLRLRTYWSALLEQVLSDGVHYERSPMYHAIVLVDLLQVMEVVGMTGRDVPQDVWDRAPRMVAAAVALSRPDGGIHRFNDATDGVAPPMDWIASTAKRVMGRVPDPPVGAFDFPDAGYFGYSDPDTGTKLVVDIGAPGPRHQPGHAHCDMLSFELDLGGVPVVIDSGCGGYEGDPLREYARSTRAHNAVSIDGLEQSEYWGTFRMARAAEPIEAEAEMVSSGYQFCGTCRHFHTRSLVHSRVIRGFGLRWEVRDRVRNETRPKFSFLHLAPEFELEGDDQGITARSSRGVVRITPFGVDAWRIRMGERSPAQGWWFPTFGIAVAAGVVEMVSTGGDRPFGYAIEFQPADYGAEVAT